MLLYAYDMDVSLSLVVTVNFNFALSCYFRESEQMSKFWCMQIKHGIMAEQLSRVWGDMSICMEGNESKESSHFE